MFEKNTTDETESDMSYQETPLADFLLFSLVVVPLALLSILYIGGRLAGGSDYGEPSGMSLLMFPILILGLPITVPVFSRSLTRRTSALFARKLSITSFLISPPIQIVGLGVVFFLAHICKFEWTNGMMAEQ